MRRISSGAGGGRHDRSLVPPTAPVARLRVGEGMDEGDRRTSRWSIFVEAYYIGGSSRARSQKSPALARPFGAGSGGYRTQSRTDVGINYDEAQRAPRPAISEKHKAHLVAPPSFQFHFSPFFAPSATLRPPPASKNSGLSHPLSVPHATDRCSRAEQMRSVSGLPRCASVGPGGQLLRAVVWGTREGKIIRSRVRWPLL